MISIKHFLPACLFVLIASCAGENYENIEKDIQTVTGGISSAEMGTTLIHEHILVDFIGADKTGYHRWDKQKVVEKVLPYLKEVASHGVNTILECTPAYLGRDTKLLKMLSGKSGVTILTNTGFYGAVEDKYIPEFAFHVSTDSLADIWIREFEEGIEGTEIRPGFIKISVDPDSSLSEIDEKIVRAAIKTHSNTGLTIVSHTTADAPAFAQITLLEENGVSPEAWVWTHAAEGTVDGRIKAAEMGAWISIDNVNKNELDNTLKIITNLKSKGFLNQLLISHDAGWYDPDSTGGGNFRGYTDIFTHLVPALKENSFSQKEINQLLIDNPKNAFKIRVRTK